LGRYGIHVPEQSTLPAVCGETGHGIRAFSI
jgi:hypothetical protein